MKYGELLLGYGAPIDDDNLAVHKAVAIADHESGVFGEFLGTAKPTC